MNAVARSDIAALANATVVKSPIMQTATALAHPNIAFIKYWGNCDADSRIPANGSISMNLDGLTTRTTVAFDPSFSADQFILNNQSVSDAVLNRVVNFLDTVRQMAGIETFAQVTSENNFPMGAGIASSASAFAALSLAASRAAGLELSERQLSQLARTGSGSACRSVPAGFVEWKVDGCDADSAAASIAPPEHWDLVDCIAIINQEHKPTGSTEGHSLAYTSSLQVARVEDAPRRLEICRRGILERDFVALAKIIELDSNLMHAVMITSQPPILYWRPATVAVMQAVAAWRNNGLPACYTIDAGPNVHVLCPAPAAQQVTEQLQLIPGVLQVLSAHPGGPARWVDSR
jgi:diphosphomevalonate decarboxylase